MFFKIYTFICCLVIPLIAVFVGLILLFNRRLLMVTSFLVICTSDIPSQCSLNFWYASCATGIVFPILNFHMFLSWSR